MPVVGERGLVARALLLEIVVDALCDAETVDVSAVRTRAEGLRTEWPGDLDPEQLLDTERGLAAWLEQTVARARRQRADARAMRARAIAMRRAGDQTVAKSPRPAPSLDDAHEALALLQVLDHQLFGDHTLDSWPTPASGSAEPQ